MLERGIAYAPDYVVNAGVTLNASGDFFGHYDAEDVWRKVNAVGKTTSKVLAMAARERRPSHEIANEMAEDFLAAARQSSG